MGFNKNTWTKDYTGADGLKKLAAKDAKRQGFKPKKKQKGEKNKNG